MAAIETELRLPTREDVLRTEAAIRPYLRATPVIEVAAEDFGLAGQPITFKLEFLQRAGVFKARGAFANLLLRPEAKAGVIAASGGNHGASVAYAAQKLGIRAAIFVPSIASPAKIALIKACGAEVVVGGDTYGDALEASRAYAARTGMLEVHAFDQWETVAGQGTLATEWERQSPGLDTVIVTVGGGGLIAGGIAVSGGRWRMVGVEPVLAPTLQRALAAGHPVDVAVSGIAADSLGARRIGDVPFALIKGRVDRDLLVSDEQILHAQKVLWEALRVVVEPGSAAALAPLLTGQYVPAKDERIGVLLCGANTTAVKL